MTSQPATLSIWKWPFGAVSTTVNSKGVAQNTRTLLDSTLRTNQVSLSQIWSPWFARSLGATVICFLVAVVAYSQSQTVPGNGAPNRNKDHSHRFGDLMIILAIGSIASVAITGIGCLYRKGCLFQIGRQIARLETTFNLPKS